MYEIRDDIPPPSEQRRLAKLARVAAPLQPAAPIAPPVARAAGPARFTAVGAAVLAEPAGWLAGPRGSVRLRAGSTACLSLLARAPGQSCHVDEFFPCLHSSVNRPGTNTMLSVAGDVLAWLAEMVPAVGAGVRVVKLGPGVWRLV